MNAADIKTDPTILVCMAEAFVGWVGASETAQDATIARLCNNDDQHQADHDAANVLGTLADLFGGSVNECKVLAFALRALVEEYKKNPDAALDLLLRAGNSDAAALATLTGGMIGASTVVSGGPSPELMQSITAALRAAGVDKDQVRVIVGDESADPASFDAQKRRVLALRGVLGPEAQAAALAEEPAE